MGQQREITKANMTFSDACAVMFDDPASWLPLTAGASASNLRPIFLPISVGTCSGNSFAKFRAWRAVAACGMRLRLAWRLATALTHARTHSCVSRSLELHNEGKLRHCASSRCVRRWRLATRGREEGREGGKQRNMTSTRLRFLFLFCPLFFPSFSFLVPLPLPSFLPSFPPSFSVSSPRVSYLYPFRARRAAP